MDHPRVTKDKKHSSAKFLYILERISVYIAIFSILALTSLTTIDAAGRYLFNHPIVGAYEITEQYLMVAAVFFGLCSAYREGGYIRIGFLVNHLPQKIQIILNYAIQLVTAILSFTLAVAAGKQAFLVFSKGETGQVFDTPLWPAYVIATLGLLLTSLGVLLDLRRVRNKESSLFKEESVSP